MSNLLTFKKYYFVLAVIIFITEVLIAKYAHDRFIRPYFGDFLVVGLIYCFVKSFFNTPVLPTAIAVLIFSYLVEVSQYFNLVDKIGLQHSQLARTVMGTSFEWTDIVAYTCGIICVLWLEKIFSKKNLITIK